MDQNPVLKCSDPNCELVVPANAELKDPCPCGNGEYAVPAPEGENLFDPSASQFITPGAAPPDAKPADASDAAPDPFALPPLAAGRDVVTGLPPTLDNLPEEPARSKSRPGLVLMVIAVIAIGVGIIASMTTLGDGESEEVASNPLAPPPAKVEAKAPEAEAPTPATAGGTSPVLVIVPDTTTWTVKSAVWKPGAELLDAGEPTLDSDGQTYTTTEGKRFRFLYSTVEWDLDMPQEIALIAVK